VDEVADDPSHASSPNDPARVELSLIFTTPDGKTLPRVFYWIIDSTGAEHAGRVRAGKDATLQLSDDASVEIVAAAIGFGRAYARIHRGTPSPVQITLPREAVLSGYTRTGSGEPIGFCTVIAEALVAQASRTARSRMRLTRSSSEDGSWAIRASEGVTYSLSTRYAPPSADVAAVAPRPDLLVLAEASHLVVFHQANLRLRWQIFPRDDLDKDKFTKLLTGTLTGTSTDSRVPVWPGESIVRFHSAWFDAPQDVAISLPPEGGAADVRPPQVSPTRVATLVVRNPHESEAHVLFRGTKRGTKRGMSCRGRIAPREVLRWRVLPGRCEVISAVFPGSCVATPLELAGDEEQPFELPASPSGFSVRFQLVGQEHAILGAGLLIGAEVKPGVIVRAPGSWHVAYEQERAMLFRSSVRLRTDTFRLVFRDPADLSYRLRPLGFAELRGRIVGPAVRTMLVSPHER